MPGCCASSRAWSATDPGACEGGMLALVSGVRRPMCWHVFSGAAVRSLGAGIGVRGGRAVCFVDYGGPSHAAAGARGGRAAEISTRERSGRERPTRERSCERHPRAGPSTPHATPHGAPIAHQLCALASSSCTSAVALHRRRTAAMRRRAFAPKTRARARRPSCSSRLHRCDPSLSRSPPVSLSRRRLSHCTRTRPLRSGSRR